jgi:hypothetical protein
LLFAVLCGEAFAVGLALLIAICQLLFFCALRGESFCSWFCLANCYLPIAVFLCPLWLKLLQLVLPIAIC